MIFLKINKKFLRGFSILVFFIAYPCLGLTLEYFQTEIFFDAITFFLLVIGYPFIWIGISVSTPSSEPVRKSRRVFWIGIAIFSIYMIYILGSLLPGLYSNAIPAGIIIMFLVGLFFAFAQPIAVYLLRDLVEINEEKIKVLRKKKVKTVEDLYAFLEVDDAVGLAKVFTKHQHVELRQRAIDVLSRTESCYRCRC